MQAPTQFQANGNYRTEELNNRLSERNIPSANLQPQFSLRGISTKYALMPVLDRRQHSNVPLNIIPTYDSYATFNPGNAMAPWSGFAANINSESKLRNQFFALQRGGGQSTYIPGSKSDMYEVTIPHSNENQAEQSFPHLFEKPTFDKFDPCFTGGGSSMFENCTRQQMKEMSK